MFSVSPTPSIHRQEDRVEPEKIRIWREEQVKQLEEKGEYKLMGIYCCE